MLQIVFGGIAILLSLVILAIPAGSIVTVILFLSIILLIFGLERIANGVASSSSKRSSRIANIGLGVVVIALSIILMEFPITTTGFLIILGALALLFSGISRIVHGISGDFSGSSRGILIGVGVLSVVISLVVIANPIEFGLVLLAIMLAITLLIGGIEMIALGIRGSANITIRGP